MATRRKEHELVITRKNSEIKIFTFNDPIHMHAVFLGKRAGDFSAFFNIFDTLPLHGLRQSGLG
jgi:hypothetical protein